MLSSEHMRLCSFKSATDDEFKLMIAELKELVDIDRETSAAENSGPRAGQSGDPQDSVRETVSAPNIRLVELPSTKPPSSLSEMLPVASDYNSCSTRREPMGQNEHPPKSIQFDCSGSEDKLLVSPLQIMPTQVGTIRDTKVVSRSSSVHENDGLVTLNTTSKRNTADKDRLVLTEGFSAHWIRIQDSLSEVFHDFTLAVIDLSLDVLNFLGPEIVPLIPGYVRLFWLCVSSSRIIVTN